MSGSLSSKQRLPARLSFGWRYATIFSIISPLLRTGIVLRVYSFLHKAELSPCLLNFFVLFLLSPSICICCRVNVDDLDQTGMHCCLQPRQCLRGVLLTGANMPVKIRIITTNPRHGTGTDIMQVVACRITDRNNVRTLPIYNYSNPSATEEIKPHGVRVRTKRHRSTHCAKAFKHAVLNSSFMRSRAHRVLPSCQHKSARVLTALD